MPQSSIATVMIHVQDVAQALDWYERAFPESQRKAAPDTSFEYLQIGDVAVEFVPADGEVPSGAAGSIVYWRVPQLEHAIARFASLGAALYRGPMQIEVGMGMCQVRDPWGNCIGLRGLYVPA